MSATVKSLFVDHRILRRAIWAVVWDIARFPLFRIRRIDLPPIDNYVTYEIFLENSFGRLVQWNGSGRDSRRGSVVVASRSGSQRRSRDI